MKNHFDIEVITGEEYTEPKITIYTREKTPQIENIIAAIENYSDDSSIIYGKRDGVVTVISQTAILRARTEGRKVVVDTDNGTYTVKYSLSSLEEKLDSERFFRISQSEVINLFRVKHFDVSAAGTVLVEFDNGDTTYVARRFVKALKDRMK